MHRSVSQVKVQPISSMAKLTKPLLKPKVVLLDLWDTLYQLKEPAQLLYFRIAKECGKLDITFEDTKANFGKSFKTMFKKYPNYGRNSDRFSCSEDWWGELIKNMLQLEDYNKSELSQNIRNKLLSYYLNAEAYNLFSDVVPALDILKRNGVRMILCTNCDERSYQIIESLGLDKYFLSKDLFDSYLVGYLKPDSQFFEKVAKIVFDEEHAKDPTLDFSLFAANLTHIGDDLENDMKGAVNAGWKGILLDRAKENLKSENDENFNNQEALGGMVMNSLSELPNLFSLE